LINHFIKKSYLESQYTLITSIGFSIKEKESIAKTGIQNILTTSFNKGNIIGNNTNLSDLQQCDLKDQINFRSLYSSLLQNKLNFNPTKIGSSKTNS
jgi:hypothetical protein